MSFASDDEVANTTDCSISCDGLLSLTTISQAFTVDAESTTGSVVSSLLPT